ncbi:MAG: hypothetical protein GW903_09950 [Alphaproteobacteria bacterium]|nr:hypothetical protein [Alphaproteobacteria bacterium]NCQ89260.1 hypothetical protein [Alphaproteobacteria bacterium]NCT08399.1 hypothetical protein [Alphaproteobacteria bacterium]
MQKRPKFTVEKTLTRLLFPLVFFAVIGIFAYAYILELEIPPADEQVAPFQATMNNKPVNTLVPLEEKTPPLEKPHRTANQIQDWLTAIISETLTFEGRDYDQVLSAVRPYFTEKGYDEYVSYLESIQLKDNLTRSNYRAGIFFDQNPYVGKGFAFEGAYRWQARMPITLSFSSRSDDTIVNRKLLIDVQIGRHKVEQDMSIVLIESWKVSSRRD